MATVVCRVGKAVCSRASPRDLQEMNEESCRADGFFSAQGRLIMMVREDYTDNATVLARGERSAQVAKASTPPRHLLLSR